MDPKVSSADLKGSTTSSQGIHGNISVMAALKFNVLLKIIEELIYLSICWFRMTVRIGLETPYTHEPSDSQFN